MRIGKVMATVLVNSWCNTGFTVELAKHLRKAAAEEVFICLGPDGV